MRSRRTPSGTSSAGARGQAEGRARPLIGKREGASVEPRHVTQVCGDESAAHWT